MMLTPRRDMKHFMHAEDVYPPGLSSYLKTKKEKGRLPREVLRLERAYVNFYRLQGKTPREIASILVCPLTFATVNLEPQNIKYLPPPIEPPPGFKSSIDDTSEADLAAHVKWMLKHGGKPEEIAAITGKREAWIYQIISGSIHHQVRARDLDDVREIVEREPVKTKPKKLPRIWKGVKDLPETPPTNRQQKFIEARYILWLLQKRTIKEVMFMTGETRTRVYGIRASTISKNATPMEPPPGYVFMNRRTPT